MEATVPCLELHGKLGRCLAAVTRVHRTGWENNEQTKLTIEPNAKTKELKHIVNQ